MTDAKIAYPIDQAFDLLGVNRTRGYRLIRDGLLKTYKAGRNRLASRRAVEDCQRAMERAGSGRKAAA